MKNSNQMVTIENARACRAKAAALREPADCSPAVKAKMQIIAAQWDDLAAEYESSILECVGASS